MVAHPGRSHLSGRSPRSFTLKWSLTPDVHTQMVAHLGSSHLNGRSPWSIVYTQIIAHSGLSHSNRRSPWSITLKWSLTLVVHTQMIAHPSPSNVCVQRRILFQSSNDGNTTTSTLSFIATKDDDGKNLTCQAENTALSSKPIFDYWTLHIHCEYNMQY
ncbi:unnamed protein product [Nesidiocoris tenuis]|uniref:CD80-like immunoglobulin C2-set domain-containing protein n=1 Tax=Nesidiocoris tenuis TaxID=355587 RepID=A0A6H5GQC2_9HEMI|nr:unnamed protein product [Nesidiocoris tenuis]